MSTSKRLSEVFEKAEEIPFDDSSKFVFFSDCHRGDNSWADDLAHNQMLLWYALERYHKRGFTYIEVGDGDELWENANFEDIREAHSHLFWLMAKFHERKRLHLIWGNHNNDWKKEDNVREKLYEYYDEREARLKPLFDGISVHEGLVFKHKNTGHRILVVHGHQGDLMSDRLWPIARFCVRHVWRHCQILGVNDLTSPAKNFKKRKKVENEIMAWIRANNNQMVICGHTHRPVFPAKGELPYFNTGSCVHPRCITGIEIYKGKIELVKWWFKTTGKSGALCARKESRGGPVRIRDFFKHT
jgi:UDP-2,3-diacylglucosamine pyrophosphatase LpxH